MKKAIVSVVGKDRPGIIAAVSGCLFEQGVNILDITQTILQEYFTMVMLVDLTQSKLPFEELTQKLAELEQGLGMKIRIQHEEIFEAMHRI